MSARTSWSLTWRGGLLGLFILAAIFFGAVNRHDWLEFVESTHRVEHTYSVLAKANGLRNKLKDTEAGQRVYLLTGEARYLDQYRADLSRIQAIQAELRANAADNPQQKAKLDAIDRAVAETVDEMRETIELRRDHGLEAAMAVVRTGRGIKSMKEVALLTGQLRQEEQRLQKQRSTQAEARVKRSRAISALAAWGLLLLLISTTIAIERDIHKRRRAEEALRDSEEQFRQVFEESPSGILLVEEDLRIRRANPALCRMLGFQNEELRGMTLPEIAAPGNALHRQFRTRSGGAVWVNVHDTVVRNSHGGVLYNLALVEDITQRRIADQEIRALKDSLEQTVARRTAELAQTNRELETFAYSVSHDLRAPLRSVASFSQIVLDEYADKLDGEGADFLMRIRSGAKTMSQLINDLLDLSRLSRAQLRRQPVNLSAIASNIVGEWRDREPLRDVETEIAPEVIAAGDPRLLGIALSNLLGNAWKFTSKLEKARLEFGSLTSRQDGDTVYFVRDNGAGFDMAYASQLFGPFQRLHQATEFEGTGIGLATVQRVVHRHGGRIWAESAVGKGASFYFTLPGEANSDEERDSKA